MLILGEPLNVRCIALLALTALSLALPNRSAPQTEPAAPAESLVIGFSGAFKTVDYWVKLADALRQNVHSNQATFLDYTRVDQTEENQAAAIRRAIENDVDAMLLGPISDLMVNAVSGLQLANIPLVLVNADLDHEWVRSSILTDNRKAASLAAEHLVAQLQEQGLNSGRVLIFSGDYGSIDARVRGEVAAELLRQTNRYKVGLHYCDGWDGAQAYRAAHQELERHGSEVVGMFATFAPGSIALTVAAEATGTQPLVMGFDFDLSVQELIKEGKLIGTVTQNPELIARQAIDTLYQTMAGKPVERMIYIPPVLVTEIN